MAVCCLAVTPAAHAGQGIAAVAPMQVDTTAIVLEHSDGTKADLAALLGGTPAIVHVWATWCAPCRAELPVLDRYAAALSAEGRRDRLIIIAAEPSPSGKIAGFLTELGLEAFSTFQDRQSRTGAAFGLFGLPATVLVDAQGRVIGRASGPLDWNDDQLRAALNAHLGS